MVACKVPFGAGLFGLKSQASDTDESRGAVGQIAGSKSQSGGSRAEERNAGWLVLSTAELPASSSAVLPTIGAESQQGRNTGDAGTHRQCYTHTPSRKSRAGSRASEGAQAIDCGAPARLRSPFVLPHRTPPTATPYWPRCWTAGLAQRHRTPSMLSPATSRSKTVPCQAPACSWILHHARQ